MPLRVASLDYLGVVAAKLRKDAITSHTDINAIKSLIQRLENENDDQDVEQDTEKENKTEIKPESDEYSTDHVIIFVQCIFRIVLILL